MMLKHMVVISVAVWMLVGCGKRDLAFYQANIRAAEEKSGQCEEQVRDAFVAQDEKGVEAVLTDPECTAATDAWQKHQDELRKLEHEKRLADAEQQRLVEQAEIEKEGDRLKSLAYDEFIETGASCATSFDFKRTPLCTAYQQVKPEMLEKEVERLMLANSGDALIALRDEACEGLKYSQSRCETARTAAERQYDERIKYLLDHRDELKVVFNQCQSQISKLNKAGEYQEASDQKQTFECRSVLAAARTLKIYSFSKPIG